MAARVPIRRLPDRSSPKVPAPLLDVSHEFLHYAGGIQIPVRNVHDPYILLTALPGQNIRAAASRVRNLLTSDAENNPMLEMGGPVRLKSYANPGKMVDVVPIYLKHPAKAPECSDRIFFGGHGYTLSHDVPYRHRVLADLAAEGVAWPYDTRGSEQTLRVLCYDIEQTERGKKGEAAPIDVVAWATFEITFRSSVDLVQEVFTLEVTKFDVDWRTVPLTQHVAKTPQEEADLLCHLAEALDGIDIVAGHNCLGYDNKSVLQRIRFILDLARANAVQISTKGHNDLARLVRLSREDANFAFGRRNDIVAFHPTTLDTLQVSQLFYKNADSHTLKDMAKLLGVIIPNRTYVDYKDLDVNDPKTLAYSLDDAREQVGVTAKLLPMALNQALMTGLPFDKAFDSATTFLWDHISMTRAVRDGKTFPAMCQPMRTLGSVLRLGGPLDRVAMAQRVADMGPQGSPDLHKDLIRVLKQGSEAPRWLEWAPSIVQLTNDPKEPVSQVMEFIGGASLKPQDPEVNSTWIPWYGVMTADVGAMYPVILRAMNANGDTVRLPEPGETPDDFVEYRNLGPGLRELAEKLPDGGYRLGIKLEADTGLASSGMAGILRFTRQVKADLQTEENKPNPDQQKVAMLKPLYASIKPLRNAGTHGFQSTLSTSCRQFAPLPGGYIPTVGQRIIKDLLNEFRERKFRVIYMDTDGCYVGTQRSVSHHPGLAEKLGLTPSAGTEITPRESVVAAVDDLNTRWRAALRSDDFTFEIEEAPGMVFQMHKNYLIFDLKNGKIQLKEKGTNFKGKDKPSVALKALKRIIEGAFLDVHTWNSEDDARERFKKALKDRMELEVQTFNPETVDLAELSVKVKVQPADAYKEKKNGTESDHAVRSRALSLVMGKPIGSDSKFRLVTCKKPLPGISEPHRTLDKGLDYSWPVEHVKTEDIDYAWYAMWTRRYLEGILGLEPPKPEAPKEKTMQMKLMEAWA